LRKAACTCPPFFVLFLSFCCLLFVKFSLFPFVFAVSKKSYQQSAFLRSTLLSIGFCTPFYSFLSTPFLTVVSEGFEGRFSGLFLVFLLVGFFVFFVLVLRFFRAVLGCFCGGFVVLVVPCCFYLLFSVLAWFLSVLF